MSSGTLCHPRGGSRVGPISLSCLSFSHTYLPSWTGNSPFVYSTAHTTAPPPKPRRSKKGEQTPSPEGDCDGRCVRVGVRVALFGSLWDFEQIKGIRGKLCPHLPAPVWGFMEDGLSRFLFPKLSDCKCCAALHISLTLSGP